ACQIGLLENWYPASELKPLGTPDYLYLNTVQLDKTPSLRQEGFES
ncbi:14327_t:CDS:1, partial [Racocetra persica]